MDKRQVIAMAFPRPEKSALWTRDFLLVTILNVLLFLGMQTQLAALPVYLKLLSGSDSVVGLAIALGTCAALVARPIAGYVADRFGRAPVLFLGLVVMMAAMFSYSWFSAVWVIVLIRSVNGFSWGIATTTSNTVATDIIPAERLGEGMGFFSLSQSVSMALAPAIGLAIMEAFGYRNMTLFAAGLLLAACLPAALVRYRPVQRTTQKRQFVPFEKSAIRPSLLMIFIGIPLGSALSFSALYGAALNIGNGALFLTCFAIAMFASRPISGRLIDRYGFHKIIYPGFAAYVLSMALLSYVGNLAAFLAVAFLQGVAYGMVQNALQTMSLKHVPPDRRGAANATFFTCFDFGIGMGNLLAGLLATAIGYANMYRSMILPLLVGILLYYLLLGRKKMIGTTDE